MDKFFKSLKTTKRRVSQKLKVATGHAEMTTDATFDQAYIAFTDLENNLKLLRSQCVSLIRNVDTWCDTNRQLADELLHFTMNSEVETDDIHKYKSAVQNLHDALQSEYALTRRAIICVLRAHIIDRIDILLKHEFAEVEKIAKVRRNILTDYDSHRNRCSVYEKKGDSTNAIKFRTKTDHDFEMLQEHTDYLEKRFSELIAIGGSLLSQETATLIACEKYLVERQDKAMSLIISDFSQSSIGAITACLDELIDDIANGINIEKDYVAPELSLPYYEYKEPPQVTDYCYTTTLYDTKANKHEVDNESSLPPLPEHSHHLVHALYSLESSVDGDLSFNEGDVIEVIKEDPSGWWEGRINGINGRFPSNYTSAS